MIETAIALIIALAIILFFMKQRLYAYIAGAIGFTALAIYQVLSGQMIGVIALIFTVGCIERIFAHYQKAAVKK